MFDRVVEHADRDLVTGCLVSRYSVGSHGYAQVGWREGDERVVTLCHLVVWRYLEGDVPEGWTVDHTCHNRRCLERSHLRLLTNLDNARRHSGRDWPLGQCANGHPDTSWHKPPSGGKGYCNECRTERQRISRASKF